MVKTISNTINATFYPRWKPWAMEKTAGM